MPAADGGIEQADFLGFGDLEEVGFGFALDVVVHVLAEPGAGAVQQPEAAEGVLDEVADDPVRSEELGDGGDVLRRHGALAGHDLVLPLGDVELVEPAEDFDIGPLPIAAVVVADLGAESVDDRMLGEEVIGQEQLGLVVEFLENIRQQSVIKTASGEDETAIDLALCVRRGDTTI